jgi:hypothetical protein
MKLRMSAAIAAAAVAILAIPAAVSAHFILREPASWITENQLGDPQKMAPCGGVTGNPGVPTGIITPAVGGGMVHIKVQETVYHPGHFRVALAVLDRSELPKDPEAMTRDTEKGPVSVSGKIDLNPKPPVLVDDIFDHHVRSPAGTFSETDIKLPNINCDKCTVQIIQFMEEHGLNKDGDFTYHHCADFKITANPKLPIDKMWPGQQAKRK